jgi:hypothetical protein
VPTTGRPGLFEAKDRNAIVDAVAAYSRLANTQSDQQIVQMLADLHPEYTPEQISNSWRRTIKPSNNVLGTFDMQASTKDRSGAITELSQRFYMSLVEEAMDMAASLSAPGEDKNGPTWKRWKENAAHFTLNLDEANHQANSGSDRGVADRELKKKEKNKDDSRVSITGVECGSAAGVDGPSMYLLAGAAMPAHFKNLYGRSNWLMQMGAPRNSFCVMTPTAFMTNEAWDQSAERLAKGIRDMPVIRDHPSFWVVLHLDGFKAHVMTYAAQQVFWEHKILVVKENSHSSQVNQAFDQACAKRAKAENRRWYCARACMYIYVCLCVCLCVVTPRPCVRVQASLSS